MAGSRSFLKWAGSKYNCLSHLLPLLTPGLRLVEPFAGSGVVALNTQYASYLLAESNPDLITLYTTLQQQGESFIDLCKKYFIPENNAKDKYYAFRSEFNSMMPSKEKSAIFLYLNRHGYNGLCRYNATRQFNVPYGLYPKPYFPSKEMHFFYEKTKKIEFICNDYKATFALAKRGDIIYCDPPYVPYLENTQAIYYTGKIFSKEDHIALAQLAQETALKGIPVIISNHDIEFTRALYQTAKIVSFDVPRLINCKAKFRQPVRELVAVFS